eukprot:354778-Chlamydomonas_euryale.AAC.2
MSATWGARRAASGTMPRTRSKAGACNLLVGAGALTPTPQRPSLHHVNTAVKDARPLLARPCPRRRQSCRIWSRTMLIRRSKMRPPSSRIPECLYSLACKVVEHPWVDHLAGEENRAALRCSGGRIECVPECVRLRGWPSAQAGGGVENVRGKVAR